MIDLKDLIVTPIYFLLIIVFAALVQRFLTDRRTRKHYFPSLILRLVGSVMLGVIYEFYYSGGDTFNYWHHGSRWIWEAFQEDKLIGLKMLFGDINSTELYQYSSPIWFLRSSSGMFVVKIAAFFDILTSHTYTATALFFGLLGFSGSWAAFSVLTTKYPFAKRYLALFILYMPSVIFWGSGILKDTLTLSAIGWMIWALVRIIDFRKKGLFEILGLLLSLYFLIQIKVYIVISLVVPLFVWFFLKRIYKIRNTVRRTLVAPILLVVLTIPAIFLSVRVTSIDERYAIENLAERSRITAHDIRYWTGKDAGSGYSLGDHDGTWQGLIRMAPAGIIASIFRPFIWEVNSPLMLLSALESLLIAILFIRILSFKSLRLVGKDPFITFSLVFVIVFAFAIGVSTFNFGTLVRYRIPLFPFLGLIIGYCSAQQANQIRTTKPRLKSQHA